MFIILIYLCVFAIVVFIILWVLGQISIVIPPEFVQLFWVICALVAILPILRGYHVVHIVPAHGNYPKIPTKADQLAIMLEAPMGTSARSAGWSSLGLVVAHSSLPAAKAEQWAITLEALEGTSSRSAGWPRPWLVQVITCGPEAHRHKGPHHEQSDHTNM